MSSSRTQNRITAKPDSPDGTRGPPSHRVHETELLHYVALTGSTSVTGVEFSGYLANASFPPMETIIRLLDELDDVVAVAAFRLQRVLTRKPKERRQRPRLAATMPTPQAVR